jgi:DNA-binding transcriptional MerR regulator/methylmalonyl-CoA mutase cobalamin-binding subunit
MIDGKSFFSIGVVERDTGIGRDTLRIWERRYGFPEPRRNEKGERIYSELQLRRLQRIRRLLDQGVRPGKLVPLSDHALDKLEASLQPEEAAELDQSVASIVEAVGSADAGRIETLFRMQYQKRGMRGFILELAVPLLNKVGELWVTGELQVYQEHFVSQQLSRFLNIEIGKTQQTAEKPLVMLATLPGEEHTLGLLMVAGMLSSNGVTAINLGGEVPMDQIGGAVRQFHPDAVGVTFSGAYQYKNIRPHLLELRELIPAHVEVWAGGEGVRRLRKLPRGVTKFTSLENFPLSDAG